MSADNYSPQVNIQAYYDDDGNQITKDNIMYTVDSNCEINMINMAEVVKETEGAYQFDFVLSNGVVVNVFYLPIIGYEINVLFNDPRIKNVQISNKKINC